MVCQDHWHSCYKQLLSGVVSALQRLNGGGLRVLGQSWLYRIRGGKKESSCLLGVGKLLDLYRAGTRYEESDADESLAPCRVAREGL